MAGYAVITENDESQWRDETGEVYHFPSRYRGLIPAGTEVVYYKGKLQDKTHSASRLSDAPHYFGIATIGRVFKDPESTKGDYYAAIKNFRPFRSAVLARTEDGYRETIPENRKTNYWRDGVRTIDAAIYGTILAEADVEDTNENAEESDTRQGLSSALESYKDGNPRQKFVTIYERNRKLRAAAIERHGLDCVICGFNFGWTYGERGEGFIHVHHLKPVSQTDPDTDVTADDLVPVCANCHAVIHRYRETTLSPDEVQHLLRERGDK